MEMTAADGTATGLRHIPPCQALYENSSKGCCDDSQDARLAYYIGDGVCVCVCVCVWHVRCIA